MNSFIERIELLAPYGTILDEDRGLVEWKALSNLVKTLFFDFYIFN